MAGVYGTRSFDFHSAEHLKERLPGWCYIPVWGPMPQITIGIAKLGVVGFKSTALQPLPARLALDLIRDMNAKLGVAEWQAECLAAGALLGWDELSTNPDLRLWRYAALGLDEIGDGVGGQGIGSLLKAHREVRALRAVCGLENDYERLLLANERSGELLAFFEAHFPAFVSSHPWVMDWLRAQGGLLSELIEVLGVTPPAIAEDLEVGSALQCA